MGLLDVLPEHIVNHILFSFLLPDNREAVNWSLVSKHFFNLMQNRPVLISTIRTGEELRDLRKTVKRYQEQHIHLHTLTFRIMWSLSEDDVSVMQETVELAAEKRLTNLHLDIPRLTPRPVLPGAVFGVQSLVRLALFNFCLHQETTLIVLPNLRKLVLDHLDMNSEAVFENVIKGCPRIKTLKVKSCCFGNSGLTFKVSNLPNLKKLLVISGDYNVNLGEDEYPNLKKLVLVQARLDGNLFINFASKFPVLEYFGFGSAVPGTLRFSLWSPTLRKIRLQVEYKCPFKEACFDVPNIVSLKAYYKEVLPKLRFTSNSGGGRMPQFNAECCRHGGAKLLITF